LPVPELLGDEQFAVFNLEHVGLLLAIEGPEDQRFEIFESAEQTTWLLAILVCSSSVTCWSVLSESSLQANSNAHMTAEVQHFGRGLFESFLVCI